MGLAMSYAFTKLASSITASSIWCEDNETRLLWITMLAMADSCGRVFGTAPGLARIANISLAGCRAGLAKLQAPDPDSRSKDLDGCRIVPIEGGWRLVNYAKYRSLRDPEIRREQTRQAVARYRARRRIGKPDVSQSKPPVSTAKQIGFPPPLVPPPPEAEAEAELRPTCTSESPPSGACNVEGASVLTSSKLQASARRGERGRDEAHLVAECHRLLGRDAMVNYGGCWRLRARENPDRLRRVLADLETAQREGVAVRFPAGYANDLWERFS